VHRHRHRHRIAAVALLAAIVLAGCTSTGITEPPVASEGAVETPDAAGGGAADAAPDAELDAFRAAIAGHAPTDPDALVAAVESAGFPRSAIERTREVDSLGAPVTFLQIAVRTDAGCIVGEVGAGEPRAVRAAALGGGRCLVGEIVTVD